MTLLLLSALLATGAAFYVVRPLLARRGALLADPAPGAVLDAEARKRVALTSLKELEYDYLAGKLDEADYRAHRDLLSSEALAAVRAADDAQAGWEGDAAAGAAVRAETRLDRVLAAEAGVHRCGFANPAGSRFCAGCGARLRG